MQAALNKIIRGKRRLALPPSAIFFYFSNILYLARYRKIWPIQYCLSIYFVNSKTIPENYIQHLNNRALRGLVSQDYALTLRVRGPFLKCEHNELTPANHSHIWEGPYNLSWDFENKLKIILMFFFFSPYCIKSKSTVTLKGSYCKCK